MSGKPSLCIHGHFYQPPRENPWIESIENQPSAAPYHDWNERIFSECYRPNSSSRIYDKDFRVLSIVNNYERISFNFGPTLMSWLKEKHPNTYRRICEADKKSIAEHNGHGNAIAQVYNHMIMPLANRRDKFTQVWWGIEDFKFHFGRQPEAIWLSETACNEETLEVLVEAGMRYVILEPHQAQSVRPLRGGDWRDVSDGQIDPKQPYRCLLKKDPTKFIDVFFYDGPISKAVGFEDILSDAKYFAERLGSATDFDWEGPQIVSIATDGETYGHHKKFGDRTLAFLNFSEAEARGYRIVNYGQYLSENAPIMEVQLKEGESGEGTAWSCSHGLKRWKEHCGCRGDGPSEWIQHWRKPLRESLDWLRDALTGFYENKGREFLKDPWGARDRYIRVILNREKSVGTAFFEQEQNHSLNVDEILVCAKLLEMQRHAMLMYTSCGWFFSEISGIETVQVLQYAARAIQLHRELGGGDLEEEFLKRLSAAKSNVPAYKNGRGVYESLVRPAVATLQQVAAYYAIGSLLEDYYQQEKQLQIHCFLLDILHYRRESFGDINLAFGRVKVYSKITFEQRDLVFVVVQLGLYDFRCSVKAFETITGLETLENEFFDGLRRWHVMDLLRKIDQLFGEDYFSLKDLLLEDRTRITDTLTKDTIEKAGKVYDRLFEEHRRINEVYRSVNLPIPAEFKFSAERALQNRLNEALLSLKEQRFPIKKAREAYRVLDDAHTLGVQINKVPAAKFLSIELTNKIDEFRKQPDEILVEETLSLLKIAKRAEIELDIRKFQEDIFFLVRSWSDGTKPVPERWKEIAKGVSQIFAELGISTEPFKNFFESAK